MDMAENNRKAMSALKKVHVIEKPWSRRPLFNYFVRSSSYKITNYTHFFEYYNDIANETNHCLYVL
jgi:hypothetical protein